MRGLIAVQVVKFDDGFFTTWRDVTESKASAEALRASEERFRQFFERNPDYVYMVSTDRRLLDANPAALAALGYAQTSSSGCRSRPSTRPNPVAAWGSFSSAGRTRVRSPTRSRRSSRAPAN